MHESYLHTVHQSGVAHCAVSVPGTAELTAALEGPLVRFVEELDQGFDDIGQVACNHVPNDVVVHRSLAMH